MTAIIFYLWLHLFEPDYVIPAHIDQAGLQVPERMEHGMGEQHKLLTTYDSREECESEAARIFHEMQVAYPDDKSLDVYCTDTNKPIKKKENL